MNCRQERRSCAEIEGPLCLLEEKGNKSITRVEEEARRHGAFL